MDDKYTSLEHRIRNIMTESMTRNTELRRKVVNVGRPDTAQTNMDAQSKLAKHGEIKTKIIDESYNKKYTSAPDHVKKVADDIAWIKKQPTDVLKRHADQVTRVHSAKTRDELRSVILSKHGKKNLEAHDKHFFGEDSMCEAKLKDDDDDDKDVKKSNKKDDNDKKDAHTPEEKMTFGKTEVDTDPKTNDATDNDTKEKTASDKARSKVNKEIGHKSNKLKEDANMLKSDNKFGLPSSLIDVVTETLKGKQKKLDKNHNGKLDKEDFKMLRKEDVTVGEIVEFAFDEGFSEDEIMEYFEEEFQLDELSRKTLGSYVKKASYGALMHGVGHGLTRGAGYQDDKTQLSKGVKRIHGIRKAADRLAKEEVENIEEISKDRVDAYREKAFDASKKAMYSGDKKTENKRDKGRSMAFDKVTGRAKVNATEEVENIDEGMKIHSAGYGKVHVIKDGKVHKTFSDPRDARMYIAQAGQKKEAEKKNVKEELEQIDEVGDTPAGQKTLKTYIKKAGGLSLDSAAANAIDAKGNFASRSMTKALNRAKGVERAVDRLKEEIKFSTEELEHIATIMNKED